MIVTTIEQDRERRSVANDEYEQFLPVITTSVACVVIGFMLIVGIVGSVLA